MATYRLVDTVPVKQFTGLVESAIVENSAFRQSRAVGSNPAVTAKAQSAGLDLTVRRWKAIAGAEAAAMNDDPTNKFTPAKVEQTSFVARVLSRVLGFAAMDIADFASDADAIQYAISQLTRLRLSDEESTILAILNGLMADNIANDGGDMQKALHITSGTIAAANLINKDSLLAGRKTMGDKGGDLKTLVMHSDVVNNLRAAEPNAFIQTSKTDIGLYNYMGWNVVETDNVGKAGTTNFPIYTTYMLGDDFFAYASAPVENALVQVRDEFAGGGSGQETVINRLRYLMVPYGFNNIAPAVNGVSQTNSELSAAATWDRSETRKAIPLVKLTTNG